jgi:phosphoglycerate kinase
MPKEGKIIFIGGAKAETKMPVVEYLLDKAETIAIGGKVALEMSHTTDQRIHMPVDFVYSSPDASVGASAALDIGPKTAQAFAELAERAQLVVWNGPMGKFEDSRYAAGTEIVARAIAASNAFTIVGGGDTIAAVNQFGLLNKFGFVSTGGGAMLSFLAGQKLPGLDALGYYD